MRQPSKLVPRVELDQATKDRDLQRIMVTILAREEPYIERVWSDEGRMQSIRLYRAMAPCGGYLLALLRTSTHVDIQAFYLDDIHKRLETASPSPWRDAVRAMWEARNKLYQENAG